MFGCRVAVAAEVDVFSLCLWEEEVKSVVVCLFVVTSYPAYEIAQASELNGQRFRTSFVKFEDGSVESVALKDILLP